MSTTPIFRHPLLYHPVVSTVPHPTGGDACVRLLTCVCTARPSPQGRRGEGISTDFAPCFHHQYPEWCLHAKRWCPHLGSHAVLARLIADASQGLAPAHKSHPGTAPQRHRTCLPRAATLTIHTQGIAQLSSRSQSPPAECSRTRCSQTPRAHSLSPETSQGLASHQPCKQPE